MATHPINTGAAPAAPFDPRAWLSALTTIGGGYALTTDRRLWLFVRDCPADALAPVMSHVIGQPDRHEAIKAAIERASAVHFSVEAE